MLRLSNTILCCCLLALALCSASVAMAQEGAEEKRPRLQVVERYEAALEDQVPVDIRWAGPDSVYVAYAESGVFELDLTEGLPRRRQVFPDVATLRFHHAPKLANLAASDDWLVVTPIGRHAAWREPPTGSGDFRFRTEESGTFLDLDVDHDRVVVLGVPDFAQYEEGSGAIVWLGEIDADSMDGWRSLYESEVAAEDFKRIYDRALYRGSVRFLDDGGFLVALGFTPSVLRFSSTGKLKVRWGPEELWPDAPGRVGWVERSEEENSDKWVEASLGLLRKHAFVEDVLPHPDGAAVIVRRPSGAGPRHQLGILGSEIRWFDFPALDGGTSVLKADVDEEGRIVAVKASRGHNPTRRVSQAPRLEIVVLELPQVYE